MPENISGVPAGRSVFHLTSPLIGPSGLTSTNASAQFIEQDRHSREVNKFLVLTCVIDSMTMSAPTPRVNLVVLTNQKAREKRSRYVDL